VAQKGGGRRKREWNENEKKKLFGIENGGRITEKIKRVLVKVGVKTYRKGSLGLSEKHEERCSKGRTKKSDVQCSLYALWGSVYRRDEKEIAGEASTTQGWVRLKKTKKAIYKHVQEEAHDIEWERTEVLEEQERVLVRK